MAEIVLVPGLWLGAWSWDAVVPHLEEAGHRTHALTLPGLDPAATDRVGVTIDDHVRAVVETIDALPDPLVLVGHSHGGVVCWGAADARPDRVAHLVFVASEPHVAGEPQFEFPHEGGEVPLPEWSFFDAEMTADLDEAQLAYIREHAVPSPLGATRNPQVSDDRRLDVPATLVACEYSSAMLRSWVEAGDPGAQEIGRLRNLRFVDLPGGHWPQVAQPERVAAIVLDAIG